MPPLAAASGMYVFGSVARGEDRSDSDVDLLVEVEAGRTLLDMIALEQDLQELLGRRVEVLTEKGLSPYPAANPRRSDTVGRDDRIYVEHGKRSALSV